MRPSLFGVLSIDAKEEREVSSEEGARDHKTPADY